jgi:hypothetical protein
MPNNFNTSLKLNPAPLDPSIVDKNAPLPVIMVNDSLPDNVVVAVTPGGKPILIKVGDLSLPIDSNKIEW